MAELTAAIAWLESLGYVHGDIPSPNLLLDGGDYLKVIDFDNTVVMGSRVLGGEACVCVFMFIVLMQPWAMKDSTN